MVSAGLQWSPVVSSDLQWSPVISSGLCWSLLVSSGLYLHIHDHDLKWAGLECTPTCGSDMYVPPIQAFCYTLQYSVTLLVWLKRTPVNKLTQNIGFSIPFHLHIHDHDLKWAGCTPTCGLDMYVPPIQAFATYYGIQLPFFWLKLTQINKLTQNLGFSMPFDLHIYDHD